MTEIKNQKFTCERALFKSRGVALEGCVFGGEDESPLKECRDVLAQKCSFENKYPLWYCAGVRVEDCVFDGVARAGVWYCEDVSLRDCLYDAPKGLRRSRGLSLERVRFTGGAETLWECDGVRGRDISARGDYFAMNCRDVKFEGLDLVGNYSFDGCKNVEISHARILGRDAFWNCEDVLVRDSHLVGKYFGWNSRRVRLENCVIESLQGFCYMDEVELVGCTLNDTTLAFEYSRGVRADVIGRIESVKNPRSGEIIADEIGEIIGGEIDPERVKIVVRKG